MQLGIGTLRINQMKNNEKSHKSSAALVGMARFKKKKLKKSTHEFKNG